jgi:hypothetical protein
MGLSAAEVPGSREGGNEALPTITRLNRNLYLLVFYILGIALILLIAGWIILTAIGKTVPDGLPVVIATIVGALVGVVSASKSQ